MKDSTIYVALISGFITLLVALVGIFGNLFLANRNRKLELLMKDKEIDSKEYQFLLENLKGFWEYQNRLYSETLRVVSTLVLNEDIKSEEFLLSYKRFWELYWSELPTCESNEIARAMVAIKDLVYEKKHLNPEDVDAIDEIKQKMKNPLLNLALAVKKSSILLEYSEKIKMKFQAGS
ncbi:MAG: hypothetical protein QM737_22070 [Ferruginibacter sp.]